MPTLLVGPLTLITAYWLLTGKAKYSGTAAGYFAERHVDGNAAESGTFTATAELTADFGVAAAGPGAGGNISGMVDDFVRDDGQEVDWLVNLGTIIRSNDAGSVDQPGERECRRVCERQYVRHRKRRPLGGRMGRPVCRQ